MGCKPCYGCCCGGYARPINYLCVTWSSSLFRCLCFSTMKCRPSDVTSPTCNYCYFIGIECLGASCLLVASLTRGVFKDRFRNGLTIGCCCWLVVEEWAIFANWIDA